MLAKTYTATLAGVSANLTTVEVDLSRGLPTFHIVGLTDRIIKESIERIRAAIINSGFDFPQCRITVNLSPADKMKNGSHYDLPIAVAILKAVGVLGEIDLENVAFFGELTLEGKINSIPGILPLALCCEEKKKIHIIIPYDNEKEAGLLGKSKAYPVKNLKEVVEFLKGNLAIAPCKEGQDALLEENIIDFAQVYGQENAKRAMTIAAAGGHNLMMIGSPGVGKTIMAERFKYILPPLSYEEKVEVTKIYSVAGLLGGNISMIKERPFRMPYSTITESALFGGGAVPKPGEISLAHKGVLFLDEFSNFSRQCIDGLRKPLDDKQVQIERKRQSVVFPADCTLIIATNPCHCGYAGDDRHMCVCTPNQLATFRDKLNTPLMDRIDIYVEMNHVRYEDLNEKHVGMSTDAMRKIVEKARIVQKKRYKDEEIKLNGRADDNMIDKYCHLGYEEEKLLKQAYESMAMSVRAYKKVLKISRTIADIAGSQDIKTEHIAEALQYRESKLLRKD